MDEEPVTGETSPDSLYMGAVEGSALSMAICAAVPVVACVCLAVSACLVGCLRLGSSCRAEEIHEPGTVERPLRRGGGLL